MAVVITVASTVVEARNGTSEINEVAQGRATFSCIIDTKTGTFRPAIDDEITVVENSVTIFGGLITEPAESALTDSSAQATWSTRIQAEDFSLYATRKFVTASRSQELLKTRLTWLVNNYLDDYGIFLFAGQGDGPVLPAVVYEDKRVDEVLNDMQTLSTTLSGTYMWTIDYNKALWMELPTGRTAPFNVTDSDTNAIGDITLEPIQSEFANKIILRAGTGIHDVTDTFTGNGSTTKFVLTVPFAGNAIGFVLNNSVAENFAVKDTGFNNAVFWLYDPADNSINRVSAPANTNPISITYQAQFPIRVTSDAGAAAANVVERVIEEPDVFNKSIAQALSDSYLLSFNQRHKAVRYTTSQAGLHPTMAQTITKANRNINQTCLITEVRSYQVDGSIWRRDVIANASTVFVANNGTWRDTIKQWNGSDRSFGATGSGITLITTGSNFAQGYWSLVTWASGNFTGNGSMTWTVASGDQMTFSYSIVGRTVKIAFSLDGTTVGGTLNSALQIAIPASLVAARRMGGTYSYTENATPGVGLWRVAASGTVIQLFKNANGTNWASSTDATYVEGVVSFEIQ